MSAYSPYYLPVGSYSVNDLPLEVTFTFHSPDGAHAQVKVLDTDPPRLYEYHAANAGTATSLGLGLAAKGAQYIKLGPREAVRIAHEQLASSAAGTASLFDYVSIDSYLHDEAFTTRFGVPAAWAIDYTEAVEGQDHFAVMFIDANTGKVLDRQVVK